MKSLPFFKGLSWLIVLNLLVKPIWIFFIDRQVQNIVGHEQYGRYFALLGLSYVLLFLADAGMTNMVNQRMANKLSAPVAQLLKIKFILLLVYFIVCCFAGWLTHIKEWDLLLYLILIQSLTSIFVFLRNIITANQYFTADAWFSVLDKLLMILFCGAFIYSSFSVKITLIIFLQIQTVCTVIAVISLFFFVLKKHLIVKKEKEDLEQIIKFILPFAIIILLMSVHYRLDGFLLERIHYKGAYEAGIYASAYRLLDAGNMVGYLAVSFLLPFIARHQSDKAMIQDVFINTRHGLLFFAIGIVSFTIIFAPWLQQLLYHSQDEYHSRVIQLCMAALPAYFLVHLYGSVLTATARFKQFIVVLILSVIINLFLNLLLIPSYGALGCCIAALSSHYFCGLTTAIVATRNLKISFDHRSGFAYLFFAALLTAFFYFGRMAVNNVWIILAIAVCISLIFLFTQISFLKKYFISFR